MRALVLGSLLLASSSLSSFAQGEGKPSTSPPTSVPSQPAPSDQNVQQPRDQRTARGQSRSDDREMGPDWKMHRRDGDDREVGQDMQRGERDEHRDRDKDRGRYGDRDNRGWDRADRNRDDRSYDEYLPRRRVKVCVEYDNGDEYCRYRQGR